MSWFSRATSGKSAKKQTGNESQYFSSSGRGRNSDSNVYFRLNLPGEVQEFKSQLEDPLEGSKIEGLKRVIAAMTVGKDVSSLFNLVINCIVTSVLLLFF
jgi:vesicle coat complex subunit